MKIKLSDIKPNPFQVRKEFDEDKIKDLSESIKVNGLLQPIGVRQVDDHYQIVFGERRYKAALLLGNEDIECNLMDVNDRDMFVDGLIENIVREDIDEIEKADGILKLFMQSIDLNYDDIQSEVTITSKIISEVKKLENDINRHNDYNKELNNLCNQIGIKPRSIVNYLKISTLDDDLKLSFKDKTKRSVLEVNKFLSDMVKLVDDERQQIEKEKEKEQATYEANKDKPMANSLVGNDSVHNHIDIDGYQLTDMVKHPNKPLDERVNNPYVYQQHSTDIDHTESNKHSKVVDNLKEAYKNVGMVIDSKELSRRTGLASKASIDHKVEVIEDKQAADIMEKIIDNNLLNNKEFVDKQLKDKPDERLLNKRIEKEKHSELERPKLEKGNEIRFNEMMDKLNKVSIINISIIESFSIEQIKTVIDKMESTILDLDSKILKANSINEKINE